MWEKTQNQKKMVDSTALGSQKYNKESQKEQRWSEDQNMKIINYREKNEKMNERTK